MTEEYKKLVEMNRNLLLILEKMAFQNEQLVLLRSQLLVNKVEEKSTDYEKRPLTVPPFDALHLSPKKK